MRQAVAALLAATTTQALVAPIRSTAPSTRLQGRSSKLIIWDCDGVLVDSEALLKRAEVDALVAAGIDNVTEDDCNRLFSGYAPEAGAANFDAAKKACFEDAKAKFRDFQQEELPSGKPYLRSVADPSKGR